MIDPYEQLEQLDADITEKHGDWSIRIEGGAESMWSVELRLTQHPNVEDGPDRSTVLYATGAQDPADAIGLVVGHASYEVLACWEEVG